MATIILGCDLNNSNDHKVQNTVAKILEKAGHKVTKLKVDSNAFASASYSKKNKGKIGVYLMAASVFSVADFAYGSTQMKYAYFGIRGDASPSIKTENDFKSKKIKADSDCTSICNKLAGMTYPQMNEKTKNRCQCVFGKNGTEIGNAIVNALGGSADSSSSSKKTDSTSSIKEAMKDVLWNWDGEVECFVRDDTVYIRKIPSPSTAKLSLIEGEDVDADSISVTDYNPTSINYVKASYKNYDLSIQDDYLIKRFGTISKRITIPSSVKDLEAAKRYLQREWNKLKRDNGHKLEVKTYGHSKWKVGEWCRVYLPSFNIDDYMYITEVSQDDDGKWECNLTLVDWPPSFGEPSNTGNDDSKSSDSK